MTEKPILTDKSWQDRVQQPEQNKRTLNQEDKIIQLLNENLRVSRQILELSRKTQRWIFWQKVKAIVYFILIVVPLILAAIYLPPILRQALEQYQELLGTFTGGR